jgi:hypothetical protein
MIYSIQHGGEAVGRESSFGKNGLTSGKIRKCDPDGHLPRDYPPGPHSRRICICFSRASPLAPELFADAAHLFNNFFLAQLLALSVHRLWETCA